mmetsp:Transcript_47504/g.90698  ORF Transcript_47504/g.90698 Transcript_47504/m.90698 type:complete len:91 (+) Transcript_47504:92-364(+)|eukprot:CAMPEP_0114238244 /NCGR_PEP_ID=MMETSP0058-20121206/7822_1 /TAXON_ID=36894 /ORGANISM="Pyramimonas parkeae, CCMP726" /LENGTH=90 /DNA_ID=CAMNT_0001350343 /DNA_START=74 /DNA_END=346 /DNA_ORIENTATION=+
MATSPTGRKLLEVTARIFGQHIGNGLPSGRKILARALAGPKVLQWYPEPYGKHDPLFEDPYRKYWKMKLEKAKRKGKGPPPKGGGKRGKK